MGMSNGYGNSGASGGNQAFNNAYGFRAPTQPVPPNQYGGPINKIPPERPPWTTPGAPGAPGDMGYGPSNAQPGINAVDNARPNTGGTEPNPSPAPFPMPSPTPLDYGYNPGDPGYGTAAPGVPAMPPAASTAPGKGAMMGGNMGLPEWMDQYNNGGLLGRRM